MTLDEFRALVKASTPGPWGNWVVVTVPQEVPSGEMLPLAHGAGPPHGVHEMSEIDDIGKACRDMDLIVAMRNNIEVFLELWSTCAWCVEKDEPVSGYIRAVLAKLQGEKGQT